MKDIFGFNQSENVEKVTEEIPKKEKTFFVDKEKVKKYADYRQAVESYNTLKSNQAQLRAQCDEYSSIIKNLQNNANAALEESKKRIKNAAELKKTALKSESTKKLQDLFMKDANLTEEEKILNTKKAEALETERNLANWTRSDIRGGNANLSKSLQYLKNKNMLSGKLKSFLGLEPEVVIDKYAISDYNELLRNENAFTSSPVLDTILRGHPDQKALSKITQLFAIIFTFILFIGMLFDIFGDASNSLSEIAMGAGLFIVPEIIAYNFIQGIFKSEKVAFVGVIIAGIMGIGLLSFAWGIGLRSVVVAGSAAIKWIFILFVTILDIIAFSLLFTRNTMINLLAKLPFVKQFAMKLALSSITEEDMLQIYCTYNHIPILKVLCTDERNGYIAQCKQVIENIDKQLASIVEKRKALESESDAYKKFDNDITRQCAEIDRVCQNEIDSLRRPEDEIQKVSRKLAEAQNSLDAIDKSIKACTEDNGYFASWTGEPQLEYWDIDKNLKSYVSNDVCIENKVSPFVINHQLRAVTIEYSGKEIISSKMLSPILKDVISGFIKMIPSRLLRITLVDVAGNGRITDLANPAKTQYGFYASEKLEKKNESAQLRIITGKEMKLLDAELDEHCNRIFQSHNENAAAIMDIERKNNISYSHIDGVNCYTREKNDKLELNPYHIIIIAVPDADTKLSDAHFYLENLEKIIKDNDSANFGILPILFISSEGIKSDWMQFACLCSDNKYMLNTRSWALSKVGA